MIDFWFYYLIYNNYMREIIFYRFVSLIDDVFQETVKT